jgi:non-specific serine/threonine protein kinase
LAVSISPARHLVVRVFDANAHEALAPDVLARVGAAFARGVGDGLLHLGMAEVATRLSPSLGFCRDFAARYLAAVCARGEDTSTLIVTPDEATLSSIVSSAPPLEGGEYLDAALLATLWQDLEAALARALADHRGSVAELLHSQHAPLRPCDRAARAAGTGAA